MDTVWEIEISPLTLSTIAGCMPARKVRKNQEEALKEVQIAKAAWFDSARAEGRFIPFPRYKPIIYQVASGK
jgi:predicted RNase H-like HicB family nuclease